MYVFWIDLPIGLVFFLILIMQVVMLIQLYKLFKKVIK